MARNYQALKAGGLLVETISKYIQLKKDGNEYKALCPFHHEKTPSFTVNPNKGFYHCFGCGAHGDAIDFVADYESVDKDKAYHIVSGDHEHDSTRQPSSRASNVDRVDAYAEFTPNASFPYLVGTGPIEIWNPKRNKKSTIRPEAAWVYPGHGYVIRFTVDGKKLTPVIRWCESIKHQEWIGWTYYPFPEPRPMYRAWDIKSGDYILITEGEKAADAAARLLGDTYQVITWPGGTSAVGKADWSVVRGHQVLLWPDSDEPGINAMIGKYTESTKKHGAAKYAIDAGATSVRYINWDKTKPKGWDAADAEAEGMSKSEIIAWARAHARDWIDQENEAIEHAVDDDIRDAVEEYYEYSQQALDPEPTNIVKHPAVRWDAELQEGKNGPINNTWNCMIYLRDYPDMEHVFAYNEHDDQVYIMTRTPWDNANAKIPRKLTDIDVTYAQAWLSQYGQKHSYDTVYRQIHAIARTRTFDPLKDYLNGIEWDQSPRIDVWLCKYLGVEDSPAHRAIGAKFMIGAAARGIDPGCKMDNMLILEGSQGRKKSSAVRELFSQQFFTDEVKTFDNPMEVGVALQGRWGVEVPELSAMRKSDTNAVKKAISQQVDIYRPPYGRTTITRPRRCVFIGTVNEDTGYLPDMTGNRRYWPVTVHNVDLQALKADRDQLWAEAVHRYKHGERYWFDYDEDADLVREIEDVQEQRESVDSWYELISDSVFTSNEISYNEIYDKIKVDERSRTPITDKRVRSIMRKMGWVYTRKRTGGGQRVYIWKRDCDCDDDLLSED